MIPGILDLFAPPGGVYLQSHSLGLPPISTKEAVVDPFVERWSADPAGSWSRWLAEIEGFRTELARLLGSSPEWFCPQTNVSSAATKIIGSLPVDPRRPVILLSELAFPSLGFVAEAATHLGYRTRLIPRTHDTADPAVWLASLTPDVGIVIVSHAESDTGVRLPIEDISRIARANGTHSVVDIAQSAGILPVDLAEWNVDFVVGSCVKWLCGGPGAGFLWVNSQIVDRCVPTDVGWFSHRDPFEFDISHFRLADDALRFWGGTPSPLPVAIARHSLEIVNSIGVPAIRDHNLRLTQRLIDGIDPVILVSPASPGRRSGTVVVRSGDAADRLLDDLQRADIQVDRRAAGIRISPHIYNTDADIDAVVAVLQSHRRR